MESTDMLELAFYDDIIQQERAVQRDRLRALVDRERSRQLSAESVAEPAKELKDKLIKPVIKMSAKKSRVYSDAEKLAYYKKKAKAGGRKKRSTRRAPARRGYGGGGRTMVTYPNITGFGDYKMNPEDAFGRRMGGFLGSKAGEYLGGAAHGLFSSITGFGDYAVKENVFMAGRLPDVVNIPQGGGTVIRFQEYLGDVITGATANSFNLQSFLLNPANERTFPFLSGVSQQYEQYQFEGLLFEFRSTSADALNSTNTALGSVILATEYNSANPNFSSKAQMLNHEFSNSIKPSESVMHMIECAPSQTTITNLYTLSGDDVPAGTDPRLYFLGNFQIATVGFQGTSVNIGELHVTYQVRLMKPQLSVALGETINFAIISNTTYTNANPLGTGIQSITDSNFDVSVSGNTITLPGSSVPISYRIELYWMGTASVSATPGISTLNCSSILSLYKAPGPITADKVMISFAVNPGTNGLDSSITLDGAGLFPTTGTQQIVRIMQVPYGSTS